MHDTARRNARLAWPIMLAAPLFFSTNLIFGRGVIAEVSPFTLALIRWAAVALALTPFMIASREELRRMLGTEWRLVLLLAFLGMWICGGGVYLGLQWTTATNGTLIYTTSPVIILVLEALFRGRRIGWREAAGSLLAFVGVATILLRGDSASLLELRFNLGDLIFVFAAIAWAAYSILYRAPALQAVPNAAMLGVLAAAGALLLIPAVVVEWTLGARLPITADAWGGIAGIVIFASLLAFSSFQFGIRQLGAPLAGVFMYLLPPYGVLLAVLVLGETLHDYHLAGIALVMGGVILATFPIAWLRERLSRP